MGSWKPAWGSCEPDYKLGMFDCPVYKKIYSIYKKLEIILTNDTETRYLLRQTFQWTYSMLVMFIATITEVYTGKLEPTRKLHCSQQDGVTAANVTEFSRSSYSGTHLCLHKSGWDWSVSQCVFFCLYHSLQTISVLSWSLCTNSSNRYVLTTVGKSVL